MCSASGADAAITAITAILTGVGVMYSSVGSGASCIAARAQRSSPQARDGCSPSRELVRPRSLQALRTIFQPRS